MSAFKTMSDQFVTLLDLKRKPVGVSLYTAGEALPAGIDFSEKSFKSYCHAVAMAGNGEALLLKKEQMGCKLGTSVLGFEKDMAAFLDDGVLEKYGVGLFETEEASAETILKASYLEAGKTEAAFIAPLSAFKETPQAMVFTADSEQVMWLLYAANYKKGGRIDLPQSGGALGGCSDITALPLLTGAVNITFLGLGCRIKSAVDPGELMMGMSGSRLDSIFKHLSDMEKPITMLKKSRNG